MKLCLVSSSFKESSSTLSIIKPKILAMAYDDLTSAEHGRLTSNYLLTPLGRWAFSSTTHVVPSLVPKGPPQAFKWIPPSFHSDVYEISYYPYQQYPEHCSICPENNCHHLTSYNITYLFFFFFLLERTPPKA